MQIILVDHDTAGRKIRSLDVFHHLLGIDIRVFHIGNDTVDHFPKIMWRNTGRHTNGDTFRTVDEKVWHLDRKDFRLFFRLVKVWNKINNILIQIRQITLLGHLVQTCLGITHCRCTVTLDRAKVTMPFHQRKSLFKVL